jgi:hypothetical protein
LIDLFNVILSFQILVVVMGSKNSTRRQQDAQLMITRVRQRRANRLATAPEESSDDEDRRFAEELERAIQMSLEERADENTP